MMDIYVYITYRIFLAFVDEWKTLKITEKNIYKFISKETFVYTHTLGKYLKDKVRECVFVNISNKL